MNVWLQIYSQQGKCVYVGGALLLLLLLVVAEVMMATDNAINTKHVVLYGW